MARPKGQPKLGGRKKGTPNKNTSALKDMILGALKKLGNEKWIVAQAKEDPKTFIQLLGKVLPLQVTGDNGEPIVIQTVNYKDLK